MPVRTTCTVCNSAVILDAVPAAGKATCPRCDAKFVVVDAVGTEDAPTAAAAAPPPPRGSGLMVVVLLLSAGIVGGVLVLLNSGPPPEPPTPVLKPAATFPPAVLPGLKYLPRKADVVLGVQPGPLRVYAERTKQTPEAVLTAAGLPADFAASLDRFGVPLSDIDHVVAGITLADDSALPGFAAVLVLRSPPADEDQFLGKLKAKKSPKAGRPFYSVTVGLPLTMTPVGPGRYLFGLLDSDLANADAPAGPVPLAESLATLGPATVAFAVTADADWLKKPALAAITAAPPWKTRLAFLAASRQLSLGLALEPDPVITFRGTATDDASAARLRDHLKAAGITAVGGDGPRVTAEAPATPGLFEKLWPKTP